MTIEEANERIALVGIFMFILGFISAYGIFVLRIYG